LGNLVEACLFLMENYNEKQFVNIGSGTDVSIKELAETVMDITGFKGNLTFNTAKPDGTPRKLMDVSKINQLGWKHTIGLREGIEKVYEDVKKMTFAE